MIRQSWQRWLLLFLSGVFGALLIGESIVSSGRWIGQPFPGFFVHENLTVGPYALPGWSGIAAGIQSLDHVVAVAGRRLGSRIELYDSVRSAPVNTPLHYQIIRDGRQLELTVPTMIFGLRDWLLSFGVYVAIGLAFLVMGVAPYIFGAATPVALPLCFMVLTVFVWFQTTFDFMTEAVLPKELRIFALTLTPSAAIHLALMLSRSEAESMLRPRFVAILYGIGLALGAMNSLTFFGPLETWIHHFRAGYIFICIGALSFLWIIGRALRQSTSDLERSRLRVMFVGALLGFLVPGLMTVLTSSYRLAIPYNLALVPSIFFPISIAYALLKYSLFDLGNALRVTVSRIALMGLLIGVYTVVALLLAPWAGEYAKEPLIPILFSILVVAIFNPLLRWLEHVVDRFVYRQDYDPVQVHEETSLFLRSLDEAPVLAQGFLDRVCKPLRIDIAVLVYRPKNSGELVHAFIQKLPPDTTKLAADSDFVAGLLTSADARGMSRSEISNHPRYAEKRAALLEVFGRWQAELLMPLVYERAVRGFVCFGNKWSGGEYGAEDFRLLRTLTDQLALSLENGRLYQESVEARERVEATNRKLIEMDRVKKNFVANICHELRTPVSTIIGFSEVLRDVGINGGSREILDRLVNNGQELAHLMDNLMNYSRMEADSALAQVEIVKLEEILGGLEAMTQRLIRQRPIKFGIHIEAEIGTIESDRQKLQQILLELVTNALKFTEKGKIELHIRRLEQRGGEILEIAIADTGIGIRLEDQEVIFEDFRQLDGSSTRQYGGTGVGLGLCKKLAGALGGELHLISELGVGSVFSLRLPLKPIAESADPSKSNAVSQLLQ
ncbi:MAG TPA: ATP-binding protein [Candidatus Limnocylindrales bacterium]|nr:ATP-binding protein [Candidatus Limnocylindrales bacterium]